MCKRIIIGGFVAGLIHYAWGAIAWMALPYHNAVIQQLPAEQQFQQQVARMNIEPGVYFYPAAGQNMDPKTDKEKQAHADWEKRHREGPVGMLVHNRGMEPMDKKVFIGGAVISLSAGFLVALLSAQAIPNFQRCISKILFVSGFGVFLCLTGYLMYWNWMQFPIEFILADCFDAIVAWTFVGIVFSKLFEVKKAPAAA